MSNLKVIENVSHFLTVETKLLRMKELDTQIKELEAEFKMYKGQVIEEHFITNPEYMTARGLVLATYKASERCDFLTTKFKNDHKDIFDLYSEKKIVHTFLLKK